MRRYQDWPSRLHIEIEAARERPFSWGSADCALWACDVILAMTGSDPGALFRGRYTDQESAIRALYDFCGGGLEKAVEAITAEHGMEEVSVRFAQRGDVVLLDIDEGPALGICIGHRCAFVGPEGVAYRALKDCRRAWRV